MNAIADRRERDRLVAEDRLAGKDRDDLGDHPHRRQDHDVDLGVAEEPEDVLPEECAPSLTGDEEVRARLSVEEQQREAARERRQHEHQQQRVDVHRPDEQRHAHPGHPGRAHVLDRDQEVDRPRERREREDVEREDPEVDPVPRRVLVGRERRVARPAALGRPAGGEEARVEDEPAEQEEPVRERVQPREGHVVRADHQRDEVVPEAGQDRHDDEEDHRRPVDREQRVVGVAADEVLVRGRELRAHQ